MANPDRRGDFNRLQAELFHRTTSTNRKRRNKPSTQSSVTTRHTTFMMIEARTTESGDDLPSRFNTKNTSPITSTSPPPIGQTITSSTKLAEFQQDFKPEIEVEPSSGELESEKGETFRKASFFPDIKRNNAVLIKCSSHFKLLLLSIAAVLAPRYFFHHIR